MIQSDTLYITDSASCRYVIVDLFPIKRDTVLPISALWGNESVKETQSYHTGTIMHQKMNRVSTLRTSDEILSALILAFFILLVFFSREIIDIIPALLKSLFKLSNHAKLENKLALSKQRDVVTIVAALYFPVLVTLMFGDYLINKYEIPPLHYMLISIGCLFGIWLARKTVFNLLSWIANDKNTFRMIEKIGHNHLIISVIFSFPAILANFIWPDIPAPVAINILTACCLFVYVFYLIRGYQIIISHHYSHFFYILYLCAVELLPVALIVNFILSY